MIRNLIAQIETLVYVIKYFLFVHTIPEVNHKKNRQKGERKLKVRSQGRREWKIIWKINENYTLTHTKDGKHFVTENRL